MESIRLLLRKCVDSADANGIINMHVVERAYDDIGDNLFNLSLEDALYVSVVRIMLSCENDIHIADVYGMWNACRELYRSGFNADMNQLRNAYMENPREFAKCIRNIKDYIDIVEKHNEFKLSICLFEIGRIIYRLSYYCSVHSNVNPEDVEVKYIEYGLYD